MKKTKDEIWNNIKQDESLMYGHRIFDVFIQLADLSLNHYMELSDEQKNLANTLFVLKEAVKGGNVDVIKDVLIRDAKKNPNNEHAAILLRQMKDKDLAERLLIENKKLNIYDIKEILKYSDDFQKTLSRLGEIADAFKKELKAKGILISDLLDEAKDKKEIVKFLGYELLDKLNGHQLFHFIFSNGFGRPAVYLKERKERIKLLGKDLLDKVLSTVSKINFNEFIQEYDSLSNSHWEFEEVIEYFGEDVIRLLDSNNIMRFLNRAKNKDEFIKLMVDKSSLNTADPYLIKYFILEAENKNQIVEYLGKERIQILFRTSGLLSSTNEVESIIKDVNNKDELAIFVKYLSSEQVLSLFKNLSGNFDFKPAVEVIVKHRELSREEVFQILYFAYHKIEIIDLLGEENMKKLKDEDKEKILKVHILKQGERRTDELKEILGI